jgi:phage gpG-like protein
MMSVKVDDADTLAALAKLSDDIQSEIKTKALRQAAAVVERSVKEILKESGQTPFKWGMSGKSAGSRVWVGPSPASPGQPPGILNSALRASVKVFSPKTIGFNNYAIDVGPTVVYARRQELGGGNLPARPYLVPGAQRVSGQVRDVYVSAVKRMLP